MIGRHFYVKSEADSLFLSAVAAPNPICHSKWELPRLPMCVNFFDVCPKPSLFRRCSYEILLPFDV